MTLLIALTAWAGLLLQLSLMASLLNFFSYFTILTNLLIALATSLLTWAPTSLPGKFFARPPVQAGLALYIALVGIIYSLLLRHTWNPQGPQKLADLLLHDVTPVLYLAYWLLKAPKAALAYRYAFLWLTYPLTYLGYTLLRGRYDGFYPYPFINAAQLGYPAALSNAAFLTVCTAVLGWLLIRLSRRLANVSADRCCN